MADLLNELDDLFKEVEGDSDIFENVPDGTYLAEIIAAEYKESKSSGRPMVQIATKILDGEYEGKWHSRFMMLTGRDETGTRRNLNQLARQVRELGVDTTGGLQDTLEGLSALEGMEVIVEIETVESKGREFTNTFIRPTED